MESAAKSRLFTLFKRCLFFDNEFHSSGRVFFVEILPRRLYFSGRYLPRGSKIDTIKCEVVFRCIRYRGSVQSMRLGGRSNAEVWLSRALGVSNVYSTSLYKICQLK